MATMVKEKRREKKKTKEKHISKASNISEQPSISQVARITPDKTVSTEQKVGESPERTKGEMLTCSPYVLVDPRIANDDRYFLETTSIQETSENSINNDFQDSIEVIENIVKLDTEKNLCININQSTVVPSNEYVSYTELNRTLERIALPEEPALLSSERIDELENTNTFVGVQEDAILDPMKGRNSFESVIEDAVPSAPVFEESIPEYMPHNEVVRKTRPRVQCMTLKEAINMYGGDVLAEVQAMSEREEALVEAGPMSGPEHPLVDLLSTFRSSIIAIDQERIKIECGYEDEEKLRRSLWKVEKKMVNVSEPCSCGATISFKATYEHAVLLKDKLPVAKMRLNSLFKDVQESYCHYQNAALLAYCQIEELIAETIDTNKLAIREALSLILQALRLSDGAPEALSHALQRWAAALASALVDTRDLRDLLFLLHHMFRQTRSVYWAARAIRLNVVDTVSAAQAIAVLDLLLATPASKLDTAQECTEESEEAWEEVDRRGDGCAVSEGALRERDLLAALGAMPLRSLLATLVLFTQQDITRTRPEWWGDGCGGRGVVRAAGGVRWLLGALGRAAQAHAPYARLRRALRDLAARALRALAALHAHTAAQYPYSNELRLQIEAEMEAAFSAGVALFLPDQLHRLPASLLAEDTAKEYALSFMAGLHDKTEKPIERLSVTLPVVSCEMRVRLATQVAVDRTEDHELARMVLEFLFQIGIKRKTVQCKGPCDAAARLCLPQLLDAHAYLRTFGLHILADLNQVEHIDASAVKALQVNKWRPNTGEVITLLDDWAQRCEHLLQYLLLNLDYAPYVGLSAEVQRAVGRWVCEWAGSRAAGGEWAWLVLRALRLPPAPGEAGPRAPPAHALAAAHAILTTAWGHSIPLICAEGISALCLVASTRVQDAVHCLAPVMLAMAQSPESVSLTPKFTELFTLVLSSGPSLVQRALGRAGASGCDLLMRLILAQLEAEHCSVPRGGLVSAWLQALWGPALPAGWAPLVEAAALACRSWGPFDAHADMLLLSDNSKEHVAAAVRNASHAPLLCECILRAYHTQREVRTQLFTRLLGTLRTQRVTGQRIHVDNALQQMGCMMSSEELSIYKIATAVLMAPFHHPAHLTLWRLLFHVYLQRPPDDMNESSPPIGPLFFSGLIKSRTLVQMKKRLQDTITYHRTEAESCKSKHDSIKNIDTKSTTHVVKDKSNDVEEHLLPALSITDLTGESSESSDSDDGVSDGEEDQALERSKREDENNSKMKNLNNLVCYHNAAEKLIRAYCRWVDEGEKTRALPHHADISRFIPEQALEAAWQHTLSRIRPPPSPELDSFPLPAPEPPPADVNPRTPFNIAVENIMKIPETKHRSNRNKVRSPIEDVKLNDSHSLMTAVDKHLRDIERLAQQWSSEVSVVSSLDDALWGLECSLRVRRRVPAVRKACAAGCAPRHIAIPAEEWCISRGAERGIKDNRASARAAVRRVARARPHAARTAAALHAAARRVSSSAAACRVVQRAWLTAGQSARCAHAHSTVTTLVTYLAERWLCADGRVCAELVSRWSGSGSSPPQQALCGALVDPRRVPLADWLLLYCALLRSDLPEHTLFSYLSKFEMSRWSQSADPTQRQELLQNLLAAAQRWGPNPGAQQQALLELLGVHTRAVLAASHLCAYLVQCVRASVDGKLPAAYWENLVKAVSERADELPFDQLGNVLREMGLLWWEARASARNCNGRYVVYGAHTGRLLLATLKAFVSSAKLLSYAPERVAWYAWHAHQEAWSPWVTPHSSPPLLPSTADDEGYTAMLALLVETIREIILDCSGAEEYLLQQTFEWAVQVFASGPSGQEAGVQVSALLAALEQLPWTEHQWFYGKALHVALQICPSPDKEITSWCCKVFRDTSAETLLKGLSDDQLAPSLAALLYLFTTNTMSHSLKFLIEATRLPWWRLPEVAMDEALERFFHQHHNPVQPYHELPQFKVILYASELMVHEDAQAQASGGGGAASRAKRARAAAHCVRAHAAPALGTHAAPATAQLLATIARLAPLLEDNELEELLSRAVVIMCMEPAAAAALPVWVRWVQGSSPRIVLACVSAVGGLTAFDYFAPLADAAVRTLLTGKEPPRWASVRVRWAACAWRQAAPLCARARLHAAMAATPGHAHAHAHSHGHDDLRAAFNALTITDINFVEDEAIVAAWICVACRVARVCSGGGPGAEAGADCGAAGAEAGAAGARLLARWAQQPRRSLLRVVTLQADSDRPTARHRLLCRLAQCILAPEPDTVRAYETACTALLGPTPGDVIAWGRAPHPKRLPRLAIRLFPANEVYFTEELDLAPEGN